MSQGASKAASAGTKYRRFLALVLVLAFGLRLAYVLVLRDVPDFAEPDMDAGYHTVGMVSLDAVDEVGELVTSLRAKS